MDQERRISKLEHEVRNLRKEMDEVHKIANAAARRGGMLGDLFKAQRRRTWQQIGKAFLWHTLTVLVVIAIVAIVVAVLQKG